MHKARYFPRGAIYGDMRHIRYMIGFPDGHMRTRPRVTGRLRRIIFSSTTTVPPQNSGGALLQLAGSAPILVPRSAKLFIVSVMNTPGTGGVHSPGMDTICTWTSAWRLSREISAIAYRCRSAVAVAARVEVSRLRWTTAGQLGAVTSGTGRN